MKRNSKYAHTTFAGVKVSRKKDFSLKDSFRPVKIHEVQVNPKDTDSVGKQTPRFSSLTAHEITVEWKHHRSAYLHTLAGLPSGNIAPTRDLGERITGWRVCCIHRFCSCFQVHKIKLLSECLRIPDHLECLIEKPATFPDSKFMPSTLHASLPPCLAVFGLSGPYELMIVAGIALLLFGKRIPSVMHSLGKSLVEFKKGVKGIEDNQSSEEDKNKPPETSPDE